MLAELALSSEVQTFYEELEPLLGVIVEYFEGYYNRSYQ